jgi:hypothetical protein
MTRKRKHKHGIENSIDGCGKGYIEERAYLSTITRAIVRAAQAHQDVVRSASSYRKRNLIVELSARTIKELFLQIRARRV